MKRDLHQLSEHKNLFFLKDKKPVRADNPEQWLNWMKTEPRPAEEMTFASGRKMYTSFMGYNRLAAQFNLASAEHSFKR